MPAVIRAEGDDVDARLAELGLSKPGLLDVLRDAFAEHGNCTDNDPAGARGYAVYKHGVRGLREQFARGQDQPWRLDNTGGLETIIDDERKVRIAVVNTDTGTADPLRIPQNRNRKGPSSERAALANAQMLPGAESWPEQRREGTRAKTDDYVTWHLCIFIDGDDLRAELSLLNYFASGYFRDAHERIFLVSDGEWSPVTISDTPTLPDAPEITVEVRRKSA